MGAKIWANQMRCLYGIGQWQIDDAKGPAQKVVDLLLEKISETLIEASLHQLGLLSQAKTSQLTQLLARLIMSGNAQPAGDTSQSLFNLDFCADYPLVAVGAPAQSYYPQVAEKLGMTLIIPKNGEVASAVGAVMGAIIQRSVITVSQPSIGIYRLYHKQQPEQFTNLQQALGRASALAASEAESLALAAGARFVEISIDRTSNQVENVTDGDVFLDCEIIATATGRPSYSQPGGV